MSDDLTMPELCACIALQLREIESLREKLAASEARAIELDAMLEHRADEAAEMERMLRAEYANANARICTLHMLLARYRDETRSFVQWDGEFEALYAPGGILAEAAKDAPSNAPHEGADAALSRTLPLDAVVGHGR